MIITITMRVNRDEEAKELFGYESDSTKRICWFAWTDWENLL